MVGELHLEPPRYEYLYCCNARLVEDLVLHDDRGHGVIIINVNWVCDRRPHRFGRHRGTAHEVRRRWRDG